MRKKTGRWKTIDRWASGPKILHKLVTIKSRNVFCKLYYLYASIREKSPMRLSPRIHTKINSQILHSYFCFNLVKIDSCWKLEWYFNLKLKHFKSTELAIEINSLKQYTIAQKDPKVTHYGNLDRRDTPKGGPAHIGIYKCLHTLLLVILEMNNQSEFIRAKQ